MEKLLNTYKLSVIIPIYNVAKYIEKCVRSLFEQTLEDIQYIFVDDCTPDNSIEIIQRILNEYPKRINHVEIIKHTKNKGLSAARNSGLSKAVGEYVAHCDSDDWIKPTMYEELYTIAKKDDADVVYCDFEMVDSESSMKCEILPCSDDKIHFMQNYIISEWTSVVNLIAKTELYTKHQLHSPNGISMCEDFYLSFRLFYFADIIRKVEKPLYCYNRINESSITHKIGKKEQDDELFVNIDAVHFFEQRGEVDLYKRGLSWRILKSKQDLTLSPERHQEFLMIFPLSHKEILRCPYLNRKIKCMMWLLTHHLRPILLSILYIRRMLRRERF